MPSSLRSHHILHLSAAAMVLLALLSSALTVSAQPTQALAETWRNTDFNFNSVMMDIDPSNNVYVLGDTPATNVLSIRKFSASGFSTGGALLWQTTYDPVEALRGVWIAADNAGNAIVSANIVRASDGQAHGLMTLKYDPNGNLLWANSLPGIYSGAVRAEVDVSNNIYIAGFTFNDALLIKYSPSGATLWSATFDNNGAVDQAHSMAISADGSRIGVAGKSGNLFMALMYNANGDRLWANTSTTIYPANSMAFGPGNVSYFAAGVYLAQDPNPYQMTILKFDASGNQVWAKNYNAGDRATRIAVDLQGNVVATGVDSDTGYMDWMTIKTDSNGTLLWSRRYDGGRNNDETPNMLALGAAGEVYVSGTGGPNPSSGTISYLKGVVAKYNADGSPQWAVWDPYAGGKAVQLENVGLAQVVPPLATLGWGYLTTTRYTQTGLTDLAPAAPTNLTGVAGTSSVTLSFSDNANNEFWVEAERCTGSGCTNFTKVAQSLGENATGLTDTNLTRGVTYTYRVRARGFMGLSDPSNTIEIFIPAGTPPAAPSNLTAAMSGSSVVLNWQDNSTNESQFQVERCQGAGCTNFAWLDARGANITTLTDASVVAGQSYSYRVRASNSDGYSSYSNVATIVTSGGAALPAAPSNLTAQTLTRSQIRLAWTNNAANQVGVKIERCAGSNCTNFVQITTLAGTPTTFTNAGLAANTFYRYRVYAYNSAGNSPYSNIAGARTLRR